MCCDNEILDTYVAECRLLLERLEALIHAAESTGNFSPESINEIFRIMHTLKGSSGMMDFQPLTTVAHRVEDLFSLIRERSMAAIPRELTPKIFRLLLQVIDFFRGRLKQAETKQPLDKNIGSFLQNINSIIVKITGETLSAAVPNTPPPSPPYILRDDPAFPYGLTVFFDEDCGIENIRAFMLLRSVREFCSESDFRFCPQNLETDHSTARQIIEGGFRILFKNREDREKTIAATRSFSFVKSCQSHDTLPPVPPPKGETLVSVSLDRLNQLTTLVDQIVLAQGRLMDALDPATPDAVSISAGELQKLTGELQTLSMSLRLVPIAITFHKMNRIVWDMSQKLNRRVKLTLLGQDTQIDKPLADHLIGPMIHIIRNSLDHGIEETEAERVAAGKPPVAQILLSARSTGREVIITIADDGRGVDQEAVLKKAVSMGIANPDTAYTDEEILRFLMVPGFSTNASVTEFSGRGVGLDAVRNDIEALGGTVTLSSAAGKGMTTELHIPLP